MLILAFLLVIVAAVFYGLSQEGKESSLHNRYPGMGVTVLGASILGKWMADSNTPEEFK